MNCTLCSTLLTDFCAARNRHYLKCIGCGAILLSEADLPDLDHEKQRYETHNNDVHDSGYRAFVKPMVDAVLLHHGQNGTGLDFGSGTGPVISEMLKERGCSIVQYDPFFCNQKTVLDDSYNYIVCCEVMEHFHHPRKEFELLKRMLLPGGNLFCKTLLYSPETDFSEWWYKNDETHVFFYSLKTLEYIKANFGFSDFEISNGVIRFSVSA